MKLLNLQKLAELQKDSKRIRNICIVAHVDHGKTTLADSLVATNGIISPKLAGKLRYMDSRKDEQERGITMKSSSIALLHNKGGEEYLVNLIDSPGHVDFATEVSTAVRLCDGAIVIVDVVEGVCPQTKAVLKQAWSENIRPVLVLNKMDRLILEMKLSPLDAYVHLTQILEQVNAVMGELFTSEVLGRAVTEQPHSPVETEKSDRAVYDWSTGLEDEDDSNLYFSPDQGNVIFASAVDGWGFGIEDFAKLYAEKLGVNEKVLQKTLWGDFYLHVKTKRVMKGAQEKAKKPMFVQFVLENLWSVYDTVVIRKEKDKVQKIADSLNIKMTARDLRHTDGKVQLQALCGQWLPLAKTVLDMVCSKLPAPCEMTEERAEKLMCSMTERFDSLPNETQELKSAFLACSTDDNAPIIVFISKMFPIERKFLPQYRPQPLTAEEIAQRREQARLRHAQRLAQSQEQNPAIDVGPEGGMTPLSETQILTTTGQTKNEEKDRKDSVDDVVFVAFARVFSGTVRKGQELYVLGPKHEPHLALRKWKSGEVIDPNLTLKDLKSGQHITKVKIEQLFLLMGRELEDLDGAPAGNVFGIGGLEEHVLKSATLSTTVACPAFTELSQVVVPIVRVAVEPTHPQDMHALVKGLRLLNQADACVQVIVQETGEHVLVTAGEVHLQRCLDDLRERYAKVTINASEPIVPFRETVVIPPTVDMVNEIIQEQNITKKEGENETVEELITLSTPNKQSVIKIRASPLPPEVTNLLENHAELLKALDKQMNSKLGPQNKDNNDHSEYLDVDHESQTILTEHTLKAIESLREKLRDAFAIAGDKWKGAENHIWSLGPRRCGPNVLLNRVPSYDHPSIWNKFEGSDLRLEYDSSFVNGFQLATLAGPLCEEPMMGVCFEVEDWILTDKTQVDQTLSSDAVSSQPYGPFSGQIMSIVKEGCRRAFQAQPQRLMAAMYSCNIQVNAEVLGKLKMGFLHHSAILVIVVATLSCIAYEMKCPHKSCICKTENGANNITNNISDCSNSSLADLPYGLDPHTTILNASHNNITNIRNASDVEVGILQIDNILSKSVHEEGEEDGVLYSLSSLEELHLESNLLAEIEPGALDGNPELLVLNLRDNNLTSLPVDVIRLNNKIHEVDISGNSIETIDMSSVQRYFPELLKFDVSRNQLKHLITGSPRDGSVLEIFDASSNYLVDLSDAFVNATKLKEVNVSNNEITDLSPDVFRDNPDLVSVDVSKNHIITINRNLLLHLMKIVEIRAGSNKMTFIHPDTFSNNPHLTELTVSWNSIEEIHPKTFRNNLNLESVDFKGNKIKSLSPNTFDDNPKLKSVDLRSNSLLTLERNTFLNNPQLEHVFLSKNEHIRFHDGFKIRSTVKMFDVEHCNLTHLPAGILNETSSLKELNLANNNLTSLENITDGYTETMTKLEILDLSNNNLQTINIDIISNKLTNLKELRIAGNSFLCNCTLRTLWLWSQKQGIVPSEPQIMCRSGMNSVPWDELRDYNCSDEALMESNESLPYEKIIDDLPPDEDEEDVEYSDIDLKEKNHMSSNSSKQFGDIHEFFESDNNANGVDGVRGSDGGNANGADGSDDGNENGAPGSAGGNASGAPGTPASDGSTTNQIIIGISLFFILAIVCVVLPVLFCMKKKYGSYKITKLTKKPFETKNIVTDQNSGLTVSPTA